MDDSTRLRESRMVFYRDDVARIDASLNELIQLSGARAALLVDREGHLVSRVGDLRSVDAETVAALVAGSFAATREMARVLGEEQFSVVFHQGKRDSIQLTLAGDRTILTVLFDDSTTAGMIRIYTNEAAKKLGGIFRDIESRTDDQRPAVTIGADFDANAKDRLDSLFPG